MAEFAINNKVHTATKVSPFMANYGKEVSVIAQGCGQTLELGLVDRDRIIVYY